jgi:hypothetical protein
MPHDNLFINDNICRVKQTCAWHQALIPSARLVPNLTTLCKQKHRYKRPETPGLPNEN